jgi:predicted metal-binding protein
MKLAQIDMKFLRDLKPCYDPIKYLPENFKGTALDILSHKDIPGKDKLWVCLRPSILDEKTLHLFSVKCARYTAKLIADKTFAKELNDLIDVSAVDALCANVEECSASHQHIHLVAYLTVDLLADSGTYSLAHSAVLSAAIGFLIELMSTSNTSKKPRKMTRTRKKKK